MLAGLHVQTNFQMYRQNSEKSLWGGNCPPPPLATLVSTIHFGCILHWTFFFNITENVEKTSEYEYKQDMDRSSQKTACICVKQLSTEQSWVISCGFSWIPIATCNNYIVQSFIVMWSSDLGQTLAYTAQLSTKGTTAVGPVPPFPQKKNHAECETKWTKVNLCPTKKQATHP